ncbi:MAG: flagellin, partial [Gammaproteobacteria bacterium]|nr:flagellin [Gammaproteobacteria bacterium]
QVGANNVELEDRLQFAIGDYTADSTSAGLALSSVTLDSLSDSQSAITSLDGAIAKVNDARSNIGAMQNRFEYTASNLMNSVQNGANSMSTIRDADFAAEAADLAKNQILVQSGTAMLAQANQISMNVLQLLR